MAVDQAKWRSYKALLSLFFLVLASLACETETVLSVLEITPTPNPTSEPPFEDTDPNYVLSLPKEVKSSNGWTFTINRVELLESLDTPGQSYLPKRGLYLWLIGAIGNFTDKRDCIRGQEFTLRNGSEQYKMSAEHAEAVHGIYNLSYPDFFLGYCLEANQTAESFLIFDTPREATNLWLELGDGKGRLGRMSALIEARPEAAIAFPDINQGTLEALEKPKPIVTAGQRNVNIRSGPGTNYPIIGGLPTGQSLEIVGRNADFSWWQVSTPDGLGWVAASVTTASNADESIPIVEVPR
jgi:hypothetical protein